MDESSEHTSAHSRREIFNRIKGEIVRQSTDITQTPYVQFRLVFVLRNGAQLEKHITYISAPTRVIEVDIL